MKEADNPEEEDDVDNDVVNKFWVNKENKLMITSGALSVLSGDDMGKDKFIRVSMILYWAFGGLQLVWRDICERAASAKYEPQYVQNLKFAKLGKNFVAHFDYNGKSFFTDKVKTSTGLVHTICLLNEQ